jgi:hypothetical protein
MIIPSYIGNNVIISVGGFVVSGMMLDGGVLNIQLSVGIIMFWSCLVVIAIMRCVQKRRTSVKEIGVLKFAVLGFMAVAVVLNLVLTAIDWTPGWMFLADWVRS